MSRSRSLSCARVALVAAVFAACANGDPVSPTSSASPTPPSAPPAQPPAACATCQPTGFTRADVEAQGKVSQTANGFTVDGSLAINMAAGKRVTFNRANVDVRFDAQGRLLSLSGKVEIPSLHERIAFGEPYRADVGVFAGAYLNRERNLGIRLKDDTDYFVFDIESTLKLSIATGETGPNAVKPIVVRAPVGSRVLMVVDYRDPMYYVYGEHDIIGGAGTGWSQNGRIPFVPKQQVAGLGSFDGRSTRTGTFPVYKVMSVTGQLVDNSSTELHLSQANPFASARAGYQAGFNGALSLDLFLKDIVGLQIPIADASGGVRVEAGPQNALSAYAFARGKTAATNSWWPAFIPARPVRELDMQARVESNGRFQVRVTGEYGWDLPAGRQVMTGSFDLTEQSLSLTGSIQGNGSALAVAGKVTAASTTLGITPPTLLVDQIARDVNAQILPQIDAAQKAWADLQKATADYQFELSLRGIRALIPGIVAVAKKGIDDGIKAALKDHEGRFYYGALYDAVDGYAKPYRDKLDAVERAARASDNATTRRTLEDALRTLVDNKTLKISITVLGVGFSYSRQILTDTQVQQLTAAADNIKYIPATSSIMISMQQIYDRIPGRAIFEQVRDDLQNGVLVMAKIDQVGVVIPHAARLAFNLYAVIAGRRYEVGPIQALTVAELAARLPAVMIAALKSN